MDKVKTILIVDDLLQNIELLSDLFKDDFNIITAISGGEALGILESKADEIDVVLLDAIMPKMSGYELLGIMSKNKKLKQIPAIIITADDDPESQKKAYDCGAVDFISRPFNIKSVIRRVNSALVKRDLDTALTNYERLKIESQTERHLAALLDNLPGGVAIIETDGETAACTYCNHAIPSLFRISENEFVAQFGEDDLKPWIKHFIQKAKSDAKLSYIFYVDPDGTVSGRDPEKTDQNRQWIKMSATGMGEKNGKILMYCVFLDINSEKEQERKAQEADNRIKQNESRLESLLNNAPGALIFCERADDGKMKVFYLSRGLSDILGYPNDQECFDAIGENPREGVSEEDYAAFTAQMNIAIEEGGVVDYAFSCCNYTGEPIWLSFKGQLTKTENGRLRMYGFVSDITKEKSYEHELQVHAFYDILTGLYNRKAFYFNAKKLLKANPDKEYSVIRFNIGNFKLINDIMGREAGDRVLITVADFLRKLTVDKAICARFSSDHFVLMSCYYTEEDLLDLMAEIKSGVEKTEIVSHEIQYYMGVFKVAEKDKSISIESMCDRAMLACQSIKGSFTQHIAYYDDRMRSSILEEQEICDQAHRAMEKGEFKMYYQSVYGVKAKKFVSAEALVRWVHPEKGVIAPGKFIPVFEKNGLIAELDMYVLEQVCKYHSKRRSLGLPPFPVSVNISRMSLYNPRLFECISELTDKYQVDPKYFRIEITESAYNDNPTQLLDTVNKLREKCYPILMDDFGSGYSSLNTLKDIPIDLLKLDMKFMEGFEKSGRVGTIVTSVARMSKWLNVPMLAEGVETKEQYEFLKSIGCAYIQGYYFSKPVNEEEFTALIAKEEVTPAASQLETYGMGEEINEILGHNPIISKLIGGIFGGLGIYELVDGKMEVIRVNDGYMQIMGYSPEDKSCEYDNILEKIHPDDIEGCLAAYREAAVTDKAVRTTIRRYDKNGNLLHLDGVCRRLGGSESHPIFCIAFNDITEQIKNDELIRRSRNQIHNILDVTGSAVLDIDFTTGNTYCAGDLSTYGLNTQQIADMIKSPEDTIPQELISTVHPDDRAKIKAFNSLVGLGKFSEEFRVQRSTGGYGWIRLTKTFSFDEDNKPCHLMGTAIDIDAEKNASIALETAQDQINTALSNISAGIFVTEEGGNNDDPTAEKFIYANEAFWRFMDREPDSSFNFFEEISKYITEKETLRIKAAADKGEASHCNFNLITRDGRELWIELTLVAVRSQDSGKQYMAILMNITDQYITAYKLDAIVRNFGSGLALLNCESGGGYSLGYANSLFYSIMDLDKEKPEDSDRLKEILTDIIVSDKESTDITVAHKDGSEHILNIRIIDIGAKFHGDSYIAEAEDVTKKRQEAINRIAERSANANTGLYDEVFEVDYRDRTSKMTYSRRSPNRAENAKPLPLDSIIGEWVDKYVHPEDMKRARELFDAPAFDPDFTDTYEVIRVRDILDNQYKTFGMVLVRAGADIAMLFSKDLNRIDDSFTSEEVRETSRLYQLVAEQTNTAVIEFNHINDKVVTSPSVSDYAFAKLTDKQFRVDYTEGFCVHPDDKKAFVEYLKGLKDDDTLRYITIRLKMADESFKWCRMCVSLKKDSEGKIIKSLCTINQVNDEVEARNKAEKMDALMRKSVRHIPVGVGIYQLEDGEPIPVYISDNTYKLFGLRNLGAHEKFDHSVTEEFVKNNKLEPGTEGQYIQRCTRSDGTAFWLITKYRVLEENGSVFIYASIEDCSERVEASRKQAAQEQLYQILLDETGTIIFDYNTIDDLFTYYEPAKLEGKAIGERYTAMGSIAENPDKLSFIEEKDRSKFTRTLCELSKQTGTRELMLSVLVEGYYRRYQAFFKSISDDNGKVFRIIGKIEDVDDEMERLEKIKAKAMYDALCVDVYNKATTEDLIKAELEESTAGALLMVDVDDFKSINDRLGHLFGDEFLKRMASILKNTFRDSDIVGRYGGDEFFVFIKHAGVSLAEHKSLQILEKIAAMEIPEIGSVKGSVGIATVNPGNRRYSQIMKQADTALYAAKNRGKNCIVVFDSDTMEEGVYRTEEVADNGRAPVAISSNPSGSASLIMRIFSALYTSGDLNSGISQILAMVGKAFDVSRVYIFEDTDDGKYCCNTFEWCNEGVSPEIDQLQLVSYEEDLGGNYRENMNDDGIFYCHDITELGDAQRNILEKQNIKSVLQCAIMDNGEFKGFLGFDECRSNRFWTKEQIDALVFISRVLSIFLLKERGRRITENYAKSTKSILDNHPHLIYIVDKKTKKLMYLNNLTQKKVGGNLVGQKCCDVFCQNKLLDSCPIDIIKTTGKSKAVEVLNPVFGKKIRSRAVEVIWEGEEAYMVTCEFLEE
ncbi:MAG: EAL domain-containing protein [Firmicutes bacterium]|nr:EAL domain-containing protein [[Eubacterium] siraeum]MCM1488201.1 EAL domain-containing protein [Bacillota bacterium]